MNIKLVSATNMELHLIKFLQENRHCHIKRHLTSELTAVMKMAIKMQTKINKALLAIQQTIHLTDFIAGWILIGKVQSSAPDHDPVICQG